MKDSFFFPHDYNAHNDPKLVKLSMKGWDLVGLYWAIIGMLHEQGGWMTTDPDVHAFALRAQKDRIIILINFPDLFIIDHDQFTSKRVLMNIEKMHDKREKATISALKRWNNAKAMPTHSEGNAIEEKRREEKRRYKELLPKFDFSGLWSRYPKRIGRKAAERHFNTSVKTEENFSSINKAMDNFLATDQARGDNKFIPNGSTWFNNWHDYLDLDSGSDQIMEGFR